MKSTKMILNYRKAVTAAEGSRFKRCKFCRERTIMEIKGINGNSLGHALRCNPVGMENGRGYAIADDYVCNAWMKG